MRRLLMMLLMMVNVAFASSLDEMKKAESFYKNNDFKSAIAIYKKLEEKKFKGIELYYNLGNAYFKNGELGLAIAYYEKALLLDPADADVTANLKLANSKTADKLNDETKGLALWFKTILNVFDADTWTMYGLFCWIASFAGLILLHFSLIQISKLKRNLIILMLVFGSVCLLSGWLQFGYQSSGKHAVIVAPTVEVRAMPDDESKSLFIIHEGSKVNYQDVQEDWIEISINNENFGWVKAEDIVLI